MACSLKKKEQEVPDIHRLTLSSKFNTTIDFDSYKAYRTARNRPPPTPPTSSEVTPLDVPLIPEGGILPTPTDPSEPPAPYPTSFAHIVELITTGQPVPGIKEIPTTVLEGQGTQPEKARRKKPWEKGETQTAVS
jgi:hypothetical protein